MTDLANLGTLGFDAPYLGRWFQVEASADVNVILDAPDDATLACRILTGQAPAGSRLRWLPPLIGELSYGLSGPGLHPRFAALKAANGALAFASGGTALAHFRIARPVLARLNQIIDAEEPDALRPASFTLAFPGDATDLINATPTAVAGLTPPSAEELGLDPQSPFPVRDFKLPLNVLQINIDEKIKDWRAKIDLQNSDSTQMLLSLPLAKVAEARLHCHDATGTPIDPGTVASLFTRLLLAHGSLALPQLPTQSPVTEVCSVSVWRGIHVCGLSGGAAEPDHLSRITARWGEDASAQEMTGAPVMSLEETTAPANDLRVELGDGIEPLVGGHGHRAALARAVPAEDSGDGDAPILAEFWTDDFAPLRDQQRLLLVPQEALLTGIARTRDDEPRGKQDFGSSRIEVSETGLAYATTGAGVGRALEGCLSEGGGAVVAEHLDAHFGAPTPPQGSVALPTLPEGYDLQSLREVLAISAAHIAGTGEDSAGVIKGASSLITLRGTPAEPLPDGLRVRPMLHILDRKSGRLVRRLTGPGTLRLDPVSGETSLRLLIPALPDLTSGEPGGEIAFDLLFPTKKGPRTLADLRVQRPAFAPGQIATSVSAGERVLAVESGRAGDAALRAPAGETLVLSPDTAPRLLRPDAQASYADGTVANALTADHNVTLFPPRDAPAPEVDLSAASDATVNTISLDGGQPQAGAGLIGRFRGFSASCGDTSVLSAAPGDAGLVHAASPKDPFDMAAGDTIASVVGTTLRGPANQAVADAIRGAAQQDLEELILNAPERDDTAPDIPATMARAFAAPLRTTGAGGEGHQLGALAVPIPETQPAEQFDTWLTDLEGSDDNRIKQAALALRQLIASQSHRSRAAHRRLIAAGGTTEFRTALEAAIRKAERHIAIFAEAIDDEPGGGGAIREAIADRLRERPAFSVVVCYGDAALPDGKLAYDPEDAGPQSARAWVASLASAAPGRVQGLQAKAPGRAAIRSYGSFVAIDGCTGWLLPGGLTRSGLTRNSSIGLATLPAEITGGEAPLVRDTVRHLLAWHLGTSLDHIPLDLADTATLLGSRT